MTTKETNQFTAVVKEKSKGNKELEGLVEKMLQDLKNFGSASPYIYNEQEIYFEIPNKGILFRAGAGSDQFDIYEYKTYIPDKIPKRDERNEMSKEEVPNTKKIKTTGWIKVTDSVKIAAYKKLMREFFPSIKWDKNNPYYERYKDTIEKIPEKL